MHQYEVTVQGKHADEFLPLLENISRTHKRYYGDTVRVLEIIDPTVSREVTV